MSKQRYVVAGPATIGNLFGYYGHGVPAGRFAVCTTDEYSNGGCGPGQAVQHLFHSVAAAERYCAEFATRKELGGLEEKEIARRIDQEEAARAS